MSNTQTISPNKLAELLATVKAKKALAQPTEANEHVESTSITPTKAPLTTYDKYGNLITYNEAQEKFVRIASSGQSAILIGSAGTGKTTCMRGTLEELLSKNYYPPLPEGHKYLPEKAPGIVIISYTRIAVANIKRVLPENLKGNCITYHKLMEYEPVYYEVTDPESGETKNTMSFEATRNKLNPLPTEIKTIVIEEASMLSVDYYKELLNALEHEVQFIFLGDINQLPPVFGPAILGFKMLELTTVELTEVYRQALESPIISIATDIKNGVITPIPEKVVRKTDQGTLTLHPWKKKLHPEDALNVISKFLGQAINSGIYDPMEDMVLCPFNKAFGTIEINKHIANFLAQKHSRIVWEIISGFNRLYLSEGDRVMYDKEDAEVISIVKNRAYFGKSAQKESPTLDYWGCEQGTIHKIDENEMSDDDIDFLLNQVSASNEDKVNTASHVVKIKLLDSGREISLDKAAQLNALALGYALTVHKSQGSEWRNVFILLHHSHAVMLSRELLYTAVTRAKEELYVICEKETFVNGVNSQRIKGTTLAEKAEFFKGKLDMEPVVYNSIIGEMK